MNTFELDNEILITEVNDQIDSIALREPEIAMIEFEVPNGADNN